MSNRFKWSEGSGKRKRKTPADGPVQPFVFCAFATRISTVESVFEKEIPARREA